jgi:peptidoglycan hydrolase-like protein with peptidoglycan-binding domain
MRHELTGRLQRRLAAEGLYNGKIDYSFGPKSIAALKAFTPVGPTMFSFE